MSRPRNPIPSYRLHKQSGQAVVTVAVNGVRKDVLLGKHGTPESKQEYERVLATLRTPGGAAAVTSAGGAGRPDTTVAEVLVAFWAHAQRHYRDTDDNPTTEIGLYKLSLKPVREMFAHVPAVEFGPRALKTCREWMVGKKWCRKQINTHVGRIKRAFKWAASEELIPAARPSCDRPGRCGTTRCRSRPRTRPCRPLCLVLAQPDPVRGRRGPG